ncbi:MAG: translation initiation factor IF-2 [Rhodospirillales bacterium]|nr:translation initiation factor IF-2 [Rhodospirillales bacterium]MSP80708.1 translation initiation factor IF-2 [Rhodospirillales bacterium]
MSETRDSNEKSLSPGGTDTAAPRPKKLELKKTVESGQVRQSFSHGRSKMVQVEVRKKRTYASDAGGRMQEVKAEVLAAEALSRAASHGPLTHEEKAARTRALVDAAERDHAPLSAEARRAQEAVEAEQKAASARFTPEEEARRRGEETEKRKAEDTETRRREELAKLAAAHAAAKLQAITAEEGEDEEARSRRPGVAAAPRRAAPTRARADPRRRAGKITIAQALGDGEERVRSLAAFRRAREREKQKLREAANLEPLKIVREVVIPETITVQELANRMAERGAAVIMKLMNMGVMATITQTIDGDTAELMVREFGHRPVRVSAADVEVGLGGEADEDVNLQARPPVVTVMGHVDHGKTSLLDAIRKTDVAAHEAGGITQHIGAYQVATPDGRKITFIDTPGHAAFTEMRARGAKITDIVVLTVAADDGVMPQTIEAIHHARAAKVPVVVAINKIDKHGSDAGRVRNELLQHELVTEEFGGDVLAVEVSAKTGLNLDKLVEAVLLQAEILDLKANPERFAQGAVIEAKMERGRGSVATVLVQKGTLRLGDAFVAGSEWGRVRALADANGRALTEAGPSTPVEIVGLNGAPAAGDDFVVVADEMHARQVSEFRQGRGRDARAQASARGTLQQMFDRIQAGEAKELPVVVKADAHGSVEAIVGSIEKLATEEVKVLVLHAGVGAVNESDVTLARASKALIIGFNVRANPQARELARQGGIDIRYYSIIYNLTDELKAALSGLMAPQLKENVLGYAEIREVFTITKVGKVAGCMVTEGMVRRGAKVRLLRDNVVIHEGELSQLKRFKEDVREVKDGFECGMVFANTQDIQKGDRVECFEVEKIARSL